MSRFETAPFKWENNVTTHTLTLHYKPTKRAIIISLIAVLPDPRQYTS